MVANLPPPVVSGYQIIALSMGIDKKNQQPQLVREPIQYKNTVEIETLVGMPGIFIYGWQEIHKEIYYDANGTPRYQDKYVSRTHNENRARVDLIANAWAEYYKDPFVPFKRPEMRSLEQELLEKGWHFQFAAEYGPVIPPELDALVSWKVQQDAIPNEPEIMAVPEKLPEAPQPNISPANTLELKVDAMLTAIASLAESMKVLANGPIHNAAPSGELRSPEAAVGDDNGHHTEPAAPAGGKRNKRSPR